MNTPGFAAETSLYRSTHAYIGMLAVRGGAIAEVGAAIVSRAGVAGCIAQCGGDEGCVECCVCVHHGGHPWQCCF